MSRNDGALDDRAAAMRARYEAGETLEAIGQSYGITRERVRQIMVTIGASAQDWMTPHQRKRRKARAERLNRLRAAVEARKKLRQARVDAMAAAYLAGGSTNTVAKQFGTVQSNVDRTLRPLGILRKRGRAAFTPEVRARMRKARALRREREAA